MISPYYRLQLEEWWRSFDAHREAIPLICSTPCDECSKVLGFFFELKVDREKWLHSAAGKAPRQMSKEKMQETERQIPVYHGNSSFSIVTLCHLRVVYR